MIECVAGVDLGGTACRFVIWAKGTVVASCIRPTLSFVSGESHARLDRLAGIIDVLLPDGAHLEAVGIGASGPVDIARGIIHNPDTLPMFSDIPLVAHSSARFGVPVVIDNDAVTAAIAEQRLGAGAGIKRMLMVTLGTGIGVALLIDGEPFRGAGNVHPEAGHIPIPGGTGQCYCGAEGCWETMASRSALQAMLRTRLSPEVAPADTLSAAVPAADSDQGIRDLFDDYGTMVGRGLAVLQTVYMPEMTILGGSAAACLPYFGGGLLRVLKRNPGFAPPPGLRAALLGDEAGAIGAAIMAEASIRNPPALQ